MILGKSSVIASGAKQSRHNEGFGLLRFARNDEVEEEAGWTLKRSSPSM
jgi:hypothetical protein